jgi:hypothetical protein
MTGAEAARRIDILSVGRINEAAHPVLRAFAESRDLLYIHDIWTGMRVLDWDAARRMNADLVRRARHFMVWDPATLLARDDPGMAGQSAISTRYFEGAAGGAALLGSRPDLAEFDQLFDWPDAVIELPPEPASMAAALEALWADPERSRRAGQANRRQALLRHDWAYRWDMVLEVAGFRRTPAHEARIARLRQVAAEEAAETELAPVAEAPRRRALS